MEKGKRKIRPRAVISLIALFVIIIAAIWLLVSKLNNHSIAPTIALKQAEVTIDQGTKFDVEQYVDAVKDENGNSLNYSATKNIQGTYWINNDIDSDKPGTYEIIIYALDSYNNRAEKKLTVIVKQKKIEDNSEKPNENKEPEETENPIKQKEPSENENNGNQGTSTVDSGGYDSSVDPYHCEPYYVNGILLVNKHHPLPPSYGGVDPQAAQALAELQNAAGNAGHAMPTLSAYRSYDYQGTLYNNYVARDGQAAADTYSARPGFSEHQSGLAFDVGELDNNYGDTAGGSWLREHCHEYGFIIRYPKGKESITGYMYEPWHIRYVGKDTAAQIYQKGITLEEYLGAY